ncbi:molybdate ABC transporter substrate-binding protein [Rhizobiales bacterium Sp-1]|uniref:Molybdate ABC transporter substrate-binding protein n=1 Tax=Segnochrobactrum spirostomi TaxID=2608987 RepID=A0A6A7Y0V0_9HYPH|nr:molybdate ABC transporter substrate-binding protein [Segnochrobactrum spirostomi]
MRAALEARTDRGRRALLGGALAAFAAAAIAVTPAPARADDTVVFAAASLKNALDAIAADFAAGGQGTIKASYAASSALAKQIDQGAPADIFISADVPWMDDVAKHDLLEPGTRVDLLGNSLALVAPASYAGTVTIAKGFDLVGLLGGGRLAMADVAAVPAGKYGKASLEALGVWDGVKDHLAQADNVRSALALVSRGEAPFGIVYATDAVADKGVKVVATFPADSHPPIIYPAAIVKGPRAVRPRPSSPIFARRRRPSASPNRASSS